MTIGEASQLLTALAAVGAMLLSWRNSKKIDAVHESTNGLSERNEAIARKLGVEEGKQAEKDRPS